MSTMSMSARFPPRDSKGKIDLHVFMISLSEWQYEFCTADEEALAVATSLGFIQVSPSWNLYATRDFINDQLKRENPHVPDDFTFLRRVGRIAAVNRAQEHKLKASEFAPEIFIVPMRYEDLLPGSNKSDRSSPRNLRYIPPSAKYSPSPTTAARSRQTSRLSRNANHVSYNGFPPTIEVDQASPILGAHGNPYLTDNELSDPDQEVGTSRKGRRSAQKNVAGSGKFDTSIKEDAETNSNDKNETDELLEEIRNDLNSIKGGLQADSIDQVNQDSLNADNETGLHGSSKHNMDDTSTNVDQNNNESNKLTNPNNLDPSATLGLDNPDGSVDLATISTKNKMTRKRRADILAMVLEEFMAEARRRKPINKEEVTKEIEDSKRVIREMSKVSLAAQAEQEIEVHAASVTTNNEIAVRPKSIDPIEVGLSHSVSLSKETDIDKSSAVEENVAQSQNDTVESDLEIDFTHNDQIEEITYTVPGEEAPKLDHHDLHKSSTPYEGHNRSRLTHVEPEDSKSSLDMGLPETGLDTVNAIQVNELKKEDESNMKKDDPAQSLETDPKDITQADILAAIKDIEEAETAIKDIEAAVNADNGAEKEHLHIDEPLDPSRHSSANEHYDAMQRLDGNEPLISVSMSQDVDKSFDEHKPKYEDASDPTGGDEHQDLPDLPILEQFINNNHLLEAGDSQELPDLPILEHFHANNLPSETVEHTEENHLPLNSDNSKNPLNLQEQEDSSKNPLEAEEDDKIVWDPPEDPDKMIPERRAVVGMMVRKEFVAEANRRKELEKELAKLSIGESGLHVSGEHGDELNVDPEGSALDTARSNKNLTINIDASGDASKESEEAGDSQSKLGKKGKKGKKGELDLNGSMAESDLDTSRTNPHDTSTDLDVSTGDTDIEWSDDPMIRKLQEIEQLKRKKAARKRKQRQEEKERQEAEEKANEEKRKRLEELKRKFEEVKAEKVTLMKSREQVVKEVRHLTAEVDQKETQAANSWRKKCMTEKKRTDTLEEATAKQKKEIELLHQKLSNTEEDMLSLALTSKQPVGKGNPSQRNNHLNSIRQLNIDCENLKTNIENMNRNLAEEVKKRNMSQQELKEARESKKYTSVGNKFRNTKPLPGIS